MTASPHVVSLGWETDQYDLRTRVKVRGPLTTLKNAWTEVWRTSKFSLPVGLWYDPSDAANLRVLDRGTKRLYKLRQSDRVILSSVYLGGSTAHPLGLSGDPGDAASYWILEAPWRTTGVTSGNQILKLHKADNHVIARWAIPNGRWSAIKVSASFIWLTNLDTDKVYKRSKTTGASIASYTIKYDGTTTFPQTSSGTAQTNPSGIMIDGTTLYYFFSNSGTTARFLIADESAPTTLTGKVATAGTQLHGGEMDTTTHTECYGDSDSLHLVAKFTLKEPVTHDVAQEAIDTDLEDELGALAQIGDRIHDSHPGDAAHPFEIRRETMSIDEVTSLAQAMQVAQQRLAELAKRRQVLDVGVVGNPALQKGDLISVDDPLVGITVSGRADTIEMDMTAGQPYVGVAAIIPQDITVDDVVSDGGSSSDDGSIDVDGTPDDTDPGADDGSGGGDGSGSEESAGTLQAFIDAVVTGHTASVPVGIYREAVTVSRAMTLVFAAGTRIRGSDVDGTRVRKGAITVSASSVVLDFTAGDIWLQEFELGSFPNDAVISITSGATGVQVLGDVATSGGVIAGDHGSYAGVSLPGGTANTGNGALIDGMTFNDCPGPGVRVYGNEDASAAQGVTVSNNKFTNCSAAAWSNLDPAHPGYLMGDGTVLDAGNESGGFKAAKADSIIVEGNEFAYCNGNALWLDGQIHDGIVRNNIVHHAWRAGIMDETSLGTEIYGNKVWECGWEAGQLTIWGAGILESSEKDAYVHDNYVAWCRRAISLVNQTRADNPGSSGNVATGNTLGQTVAPAIDTFGTFDSAVPVISPNTTLAAGNGTWTTNSVPATPEAGH